jgi:hypothetical protein
VKNSEKKPFCITHNFAPCNRTFTQLRENSPKLKKKFKALYINFHETESKAFSKSVRRISPALIIFSLQ